MRAYRLLLRLFPRTFRVEYGDEMARLFRDRLREVRNRPWDRAWLWGLAAMDVAFHATVEWVGVLADVTKMILREGVTMSAWTQDLRLGVRGLVRRPGFTLAAVVTLALGIGANVAIFSVVNGVLLKPLPYPDSDRLVGVWTVDTRDGSQDNSVDHPDLRYWQESVSGFLVAGVSESHPTLTGLGQPEVIQAARVSDGLLSVFGLKPELGRDIRRDEDVKDGPDVVVLSHAFWKERMGGSPDVLGRSLTLGGEGWEIVGVAPKGFDYPKGAVLWTPKHHDEEGCGHGCRVMSAVGRIMPGTTREAVQAQLDAASAHLTEAFPDIHRDDGTALEPMLGQEVAGVRNALWVLTGAVAMVLLIACANVANLLLVRAEDRREEVALRSTLGASKARLARQLLTESLLLSVVAGAGGVALAWWGLRTLVAMAPPDIPRLDQVGLDGSVLGFALLVVVAVTGIFGLVPALQVAGASPMAALVGGRRTEGGPHSRMSRSVLLAGEVALTLTLLLGAGLLFGTLRNIRATDLGFDVQRIERFRVSAPDSRYDTEARVRFFRELEARLTSLPQVSKAGAAFGAPLSDGRMSTTMQLLDRPPVGPADESSMVVRIATPGYLEAAGIPLLEGRWVDPTDVRSTEGVVVINQAAVDRFYPHVDPLGRRLHLNISWGYGDDPQRTIVGVVGNARTDHATEPDDPAAYLPEAQFGASVMSVTMRVASGAETALPQARNVVHAMDPDLAITSVERVQDAVDRELAPTRFYLTLVSAFSALALILAAVGLCGVVAYSVSRRTREIGIRMALGARGNDVVGMVVREGVAPAVAGVALGILGSVWGGRILGSLLYGVKPQDPVTLVTVTTILLSVVLAATLLPSLRASRVPPASALRMD